MSTATARVVGVGSSVTLRDLRNRDEFTLTIQNSDQPLAFEPDRVLPDSTVAQALLGARLHDIVSWPTPRGVSDFRITAIDRRLP